METYVSTHSKVYILTNEGDLRKPNISEVEFADSYQPFDIQLEDGPIGDQKIKKCKCENDEIILEITKDDEILISTAHKADHSLYQIILKLGIAGQYKLKIKRCENLKDMYFLDKAVESYRKIFEK